MFVVTVPALPREQHGIMSHQRRRDTETGLLRAGLPRPVNEILNSILSAERNLVAFPRLPFGARHLAVSSAWDEDRFGA